MQQGPFITLTGGATGNAAAQGGYNYFTQQEQQPQRFVYYTLPQGSHGTAGGARPAATAPMSSIMSPVTPLQPHQCGPASSGEGVGGGRNALYAPGSLMHWDLGSSLNASVNVNVAQSASCVSATAGRGGVDSCMPPGAASAAAPGSAATPAYASAQSAPSLFRRISSPAPPHVDSNLSQLNNDDSGAVVGAGSGGGAASVASSGRMPNAFLSNDFAAIMSAAKQTGSLPYRSASCNAITPTAVAAVAAPADAPVPYTALSYPASPPLPYTFPPASSVFTPSVTGSSVSGGVGSGMYAPLTGDAASGGVNSPLLVLVPESGSGSGSQPFASPEMGGGAPTVAAAPSSGACPLSSPLMYPSVTLGDAVPRSQLSAESSLRLPAASRSSGFMSAQQSPMQVERPPSPHLQQQQAPQFFSPTMFMPVSFGQAAPAGYSIVGMTPQQQQQPAPSTPPQQPLQHASAASTAYYVLAAGQLAGAGASPYAAFTAAAAPAMQPHLVQLQQSQQLPQAAFMAATPPAHGFVFSTTAGAATPTQYTAALPHVMPVFHGPTTSMPPSMPTGPVYDERVLEHYRSLIAASTSAATAAAAARSNEKQLSVSAKGKSGSVSANVADADKPGSGEGGAVTGKSKAQGGGGAAAAPVVQGLPFDEDPVEIDTTKQQLIVNYLPQRLSNEQFKDLFRAYGELMEEKSHIIYDFRHRKVVVVASPTPAAAAASPTARSGGGSSSDAEGHGARSLSSSAVTLQAASKRASEGAFVSGPAEQATTPRATTSPLITAAAAAANDTCVAADPSVTFSAATNLRGVPRSKGYGFIYYKDGASTEAAIKELNGKEIDGKRIKVRYADQQRHEGDGAAGGGEAEAEKEGAEDGMAGGEATSAAPGCNSSGSSSCSSASSK